MLTRVKYLVCLVLLLGVAGSASAQTYHWWTGAVDNAWNDPGNWDCGLVPDQATLVSDAFINLDGVPCVIDGTQPCANSQWLTVSFDTPAQLDIVAGGQMGTTIWGPGEMFVGAHPSGANTANGVVNIDGVGTVARPEGLRIGIGPDPGAGTVNVTGGAEFISGHWGTRIGSRGTVNLIDGTMTVEGNAGTEGMTILPGGLLDICGSSVLYLSTDVTADVDAWVASGVMTGDGIVGNLIRTFDGEWTVVQLPEPATMMLLGLGGLLLRRRRA